MHARAHVAHSRMHAGTRACRYTCLRIVAEAGANRAYACTRRPSCGGRMRGSCPREKRNVRACVRDPSDSRVPTTRNSNAKRRDRIACHRRVPRDHRHSRSREARGGSQGGGGRERDLIAGSRFHGERVLFTETQQAGWYSQLWYSLESSQKSKVVAQFSSSSSSSLRDINGKLMVESCIYIPLQRRIVLDRGWKDTGDGVLPPSF